ncbi:MAG: dienelactone hydrolase family protein, partial [Proteobacteria bacterium]|nr:dienelactone hydrolase family protein [Pseudomonadota bacterium]
MQYPSPGGNSGTMRGYLVQPPGNGPYPTVIVFHENRGHRSYVEDVARAGWAWRDSSRYNAGWLAPVGGYPGNDDEGRTLQSGLDQTKLRVDMVNSA